MVNKRQRNALSRKVLNLALYGSNPGPRRTETYRYLSGHRMLRDGFFIFRLEHPELKNHSFSAGLAQEFATHFRLHLDWEEWLNRSDHLTNEDHRHQVKSKVFEDSLDRAPPEFVELVRSLKHRIESALFASTDQLRVSMENYPSVLMNSGDTDIQSLHMDWSLDTSDRYSVIMAITRIELVVALGLPPRETNAHNLEFVKSQVEMHSLILDPGEIICFHGWLIHAGGKGPEGTLRLHWYAAKNLLTKNVPENFVVPIRKKYNKRNLPLVPRE